MEEVGEEARVGREPSLILGEMSNTHDAPSERYPSPVVNSPDSSVHSGRQPADFTEHATMTAGTDPSTAHPSADVERSSPGIPTIDELFYTAKTSKAGSPLKSSQTSVLAGKSKKTKIKAESFHEGDETSLDAKRNLFPNATQPLPGKEEIDARRRRSSAFRMPEGTQVVTLSSSPVSGDEGEKDSPLPSGDGWVAKRNNPPKPAVTGKGKRGGGQARRRSSRKL